MQSKRWQLSQADWEKWSRDTLLFFIPVAVIYLGAISSKLQEPFYVFKAIDLIPSNFTIGAIVSYLANTLLNLSRKLISGERG